MTSNSKLPSSDKKDTSEFPTMSDTVEAVIQEVDRLNQQILMLKAAFYTNMLRCYPDKPHEEIAKAIEASIGEPQAPEVLAWIGQGLLPLVPEELEKLKRWEPGTATLYDTPLYANPYAIDSDTLKDAERYRYLRDVGATFCTHHDTPQETKHHVCEWAMDAAIDKALADLKSEDSLDQVQADTSKSNLALMVEIAEKREGYAGLLNEARKLGADIPWPPKDEPR